MKRKTTRKKTTRKKIRNKIKTKSLLTSLALPVVIAVGVSGCGYNNSTQTTSDNGERYLEEQIQNEVIYMPERNLFRYGSFTEFSGINKVLPSEFDNRPVCINVVSDENPRYFSESDPKGYEAKVRSSSGFIDIKLSSNEGSEVLAKLRKEFYPLNISKGEPAQLPPGDY